MYHPCILYTLISSENCRLICRSHIITNRKKRCLRILRFQKCPFRLPFKFLSEFSDKLFIGWNISSCFKICSLDKSGTFRCKNLISDDPFSFCVHKHFEFRINYHISGIVGKLGKLSEE
ncbi:MAG: hypothetical protein ACD_78C00281G0003, partial [uncultured bacterium (gcode 4)]